MASPYPQQDRLEHIGFLACALFLGLLLGWVGGTWTAIRNLSDCTERAN